MRIFALIACALCFFAQNLQAADGVLFAVSYRAIPAGALISVRPWDNSDENIRLAREIEDSLRGQGYRIADKAPLVMSFSTRDVIGQWTQGERRSVLEIEGHGGREGGEDASVRLNLFASDRGGVLNPGETSKTVVPSKYGIEITVDSATGERHWQGEATANLERSDGFSLTKSMVPILVGTLGKTVRRQQFQIR